jgi:hypothetical protein
VFSIRDAHLVELMRGIRDYLPQELVPRFEQTGDIVHLTPPSIIHGSSSYGAITYNLIMRPAAVGNRSRFSAG